MTAVEISKKALDVALVLGGCFVIGSFELGVADECFAVLAPVFWLAFEVSIFSQ